MTKVSQNAKVKIPTPTCFPITCEIITQESAEHGDAAQRGFMSQTETLRDAIETLMRFDISEGIQHWENYDRWFTVYFEMNNETGSYENRSIHFPDNVTQSSIRRVVRLIRQKLGEKI